MRKRCRIVVVLLLCISSFTYSTATEHKAQSSDSTKQKTLVFQRKWEPKEKAFSFLLPEGWTIKGGIFHVDPLQMGGPGNSIESKCDMSLMKDSQGSVYFRWLPTWNFVDFSRNPQGAMLTNMFRQGSRYQGMEVKSMPGFATYLRELFTTLHPTATDVNAVRTEPIPELAEVYRKMYKSADDQLAMSGMSRLGYDAGGIVVEYNESGHRYKEALVTCLIDFRAAALIWSNQYTLSMRAPLEEAESWKPILEIIRQSMKINPQWFAAQAKAAGQRGQVVLDTMKYIQSVDQEIYENRTKTNAKIQHEDYLFLTNQEEYVNPFTGKVEQDTAEYLYRWTNAEGDMIYTDQQRFNPNEQEKLSDRQWKLTPVRPR